MTNPYADAREHPFRAAFAPVVWWRTYTRLLYLLLSFPLGLAYFVVYLTGGTLGLGLLVLTVGVLILALLLLALRPIAHLERMLAVGLVGERIPPVPAPRTTGPGFWRWLEGVTKDSVTWKTLGFVLIRFPIGLVSWTFVVVFVTTALALVLVPVIEPLGGDVDFGFWVPATPAELGAVSLIGLGAFVVVIHFVNGLAVAWGKLARFAFTRGAPGAPVAAAPATPGPAPETFTTAASGFSPLPA